MKTPAPKKPKTVKGAAAPVPDKRVPKTKAPPARKNAVTRGITAKKAAPAKKPPPKPIRKVPVKKAKAPAKIVAEVVEPVDEDAITALDSAIMGLTVREARFVDRYITHYNGSLAYIEAGFEAKNANVARVGASRLLIRANVKAYLAHRIKAMIARDEEHQDSLMVRLRMMAFADAREISEHHKGSCRFCWGKFHRYQYSANEWDDAVSSHAEKQEKAAAAGKPMPKAPEPKGGPGYEWGREPNPECPECAGHGLGKTIVHDTRYLSPAAIAIYAGVKDGKDGIDAKTYGQDKALDTLTKIAKLYDDATKVTVNFSPEAMDEKFGSKMQASHDRMAQMREERKAAREKRGD